MSERPLHIWQVNCRIFRLKFKTLYDWACRRSELARLLITWTGLGKSNGLQVSTDSALSSICGAVCFFFLCSCIGSTKTNSLATENILNICTYYQTVSNFIGKTSCTHLFMFFYRPIDVFCNEKRPISGLVLAIKKRDLVVMV